MSHFEKSSASCKAILFLTFGQFSWGSALRASYPHCREYEVVKDEALHLPVGVVREWKGHQQCGRDFEAWLDKFTEAGHKLIDPEEEKKKEEEKKRTADQSAGGTAPAGGAPKRARTSGHQVDEKLMLAGSDISQPLITEIKLQPGLTLHCRSEKTFYLLNSSDKATQQADLCVGLFGSGSYKIIKNNQERPANSIPLKFENHSTLVVLNGSVSTLGDVVQAERQKKPDAKICYYDLIGSAESVNQFDLKSTHHVVFVPKPGEDGGTLGKHNCASQLPRDADSSCIRLLWHVRWCQKGLSPVKPALRIVGSLDLKAGWALKLHKAD